MKWIILTILGVAIGYWLAKRNRDSHKSTTPPTNGVLNPEQVEQKRQNMEKIMNSFGPDDEITNNKVEQLLGISNASAERYLDELEKQGKLQQIGNEGKYVIYKKI